MLFARALVITFLTITFFGCIGQPEPEEKDRDPLEVLASNRLVWEQNKPNYYHYLSSGTSASQISRYYWVENTEGEQSSLIVPDYHSAYPSSWNTVTIEKLFPLVEELIVDANFDVHVSYDSTYGFPSLIRYQRKGLSNSNPWTYNIEYFNTESEGYFSEYFSSLEKWHLTSPDLYQFQISNLCDCEMRGTTMITVDKDKGAIHASDLESNTPVNLENFSFPVTINDIFAYLFQMLYEHELVSMNFDSISGAPSYIEDQLGAPRPYYKVKISNIDSVSKDLDERNEFWQQQDIQDYSFTLKGGNFLIEDTWDRLAKNQFTFHILVEQGNITRVIDLSDGFYDETFIYEPMLIKDFFSYARELQLENWDRIQMAFNQEFSIPEYIEVGGNNPTFWYSISDFSTGTESTKNFDLIETKVNTILDAKQNWLSHVIDYYEQSWQFDCACSDQGSYESTVKIYDPVKILNINKVLEDGTSASAFTNPLWDIDSLFEWLLDLPGQDLLNLEIEFDDEFSYPSEVVYAPGDNDANAFQFTVTEFITFEQRLAERLNQWETNQQRWLDKNILEYSFKVSLNRSPINGGLSLYEVTVLESGTLVMDLDSDTQVTGELGFESIDELFTKAVHGLKNGIVYHYNEEYGFPSRWGHDHPQVTDDEYSYGVYDLKIISLR